MHWAQYAKLMETWYQLIRAAPGFLDIPQALGKRKLTITRYGIRPLDRDNLYTSMKPVIDVLKPAKHESGIYRSGPKKDQHWRRDRIGHGLIAEDDDRHLELVVRQASIKGLKGLVLKLEDLA